MKRSSKFWRALAGSGLGLALAATAGAADDKGFRDVLDTPALTSALASRAPLSALARAGENRLVAAGQRGHILWSDDGGAKWQQATVPLSSDLLALSFP